MAEQRSSLNNAPSPAPSFGCGFLTANIRRSPQGVMLCEGVIVNFFVWDLPCDRTGQLVLTVLDSRSGETRGDLTLRNVRQDRQLHNQQFTLRSIRDGAPATVATPLRFHLPAEGRYELVASLPESVSTLTVPFEVEKRPWPTFAREDLDFLAEHPQVRQTLRVKTPCPKCRAAYEFEEGVQPDHKPPLGTMRFPDLGFMNCEHCGHAITLRDLQGQVRQTLLNGVQRERAKAEQNKS
jgi:hypothetical protein